MSTRYFEDFTPATVQESAPYTITRDEIIAFASKYDPQPFHVSEERAKNSFFGGLIASGWQTCAIAMRLISDLYILESASMGSPGVDDIRWTKPVRPGDELRLRWTVLECKPSQSRPEMGAMRSRWEVFNQHDELVMHMTGWGLFRRKGH